MVDNLIEGDTNVIIEELSFAVSSAISFVNLAISKFVPAFLVFVSLLFCAARLKTKFIINFVLSPKLVTHRRRR